jgi:hypothetical protein
MNEQFWYDNIKILIEKDKLKDFFPTKEMSIERKLNALVRCSLYISFLMSVLTNNINYIFVLILTLFITYMIYIFRKDDNSN